MLRILREQTNTEEDILSAYWATSLWGFDHLCFGLGRGSIIPPGPAMVLMDRMDLNLKKIQKAIQILTPMYHLPHFEHIGLIFCFLC